MGLAVVYHVPTFGSLISTVHAPKLLVKSVRLRVTVIRCNEFFTRNFVFLDFLRVGADPNNLFLDYLLGFSVKCWKLKHLFCLNLVGVATSEKKLGFHLLLEYERLILL